tara:strand:- start:82 stop:1020 length:939 start_codon:yes stop_codon:yes gene_type:complete
MSDFWDMDNGNKKVIKPVKEQGKRLKITKEMILSAQDNTKSNREASQWIGVCFNTYKKWAKHYGVFEQHLNQAGVGISKGFAVTSENGTVKKAKGHDKRWDSDGNPNYGSAVYILGLEGEKLEYFRKTWNREFYKVGKANDIRYRVNDLLKKKELGIPWHDDMWNYWGKNADVIEAIPTRTEAEAYETEKAFHYKLNGNKVHGIVSQEMFEVSRKLINELIQIEVIDYKSRFSVVREKLKNKIPEVMELETLSNVKHKTINIPTLMSKWAMLVPGGMPDTKNEIHLNHLKLLLKEMNMPDKFIEGLYENLTS